MENIRRKIIYVDDINYNLISVKSRLKERYEIYPAQSVIKLYEILENFKPDLILLDINMPLMNGYDILKKLKADSKYADIPVIFLTSRDDRESLYGGIKLGAVGYVVKPFSDADLIEQIEIQFNPEKKKRNCPCIIYVDDVNYNLVTLKCRLEDHYTIYPSQSVASMFEIIDFVKPDLILLDINMPGVNGYDAIKKLKADSKYADIPVIFLTSRDDKESVSEGIKLGASGYVLKPFSDMDLIKQIDNQLNAKKGL